MKIIIIAFVFFMVPLLGFSADKLVDEDFEGVTTGCIPEIDPTGNGEISRVARTMHMDCSSCSEGSGSGCDSVPLGDTGAFVTGSDCSGGSGKCVRAQVYGPGTYGTYTEPKFRLDNKIGGGQDVYIKFDVKLAANLPTSEFENLKLVHITSDTTADTPGVDEPELNFNPGSEYSWYNYSDNCGGVTEYYFTRADTEDPNSINDGDWHTYEIYIHVGSTVVTGAGDASADGIVRLWEDDILLLEDTSVPMRCSAGETTTINSVSFIRHIKGLVSNGGNIYFDNIEVWDGMPDAEVSTPTMQGVSPSGCTMQ